MDFSIRLGSGNLLSGTVRSPGENARAAVVMVHGIGEHIQRYDGWGDLFLKEGVAFMGLDLPGHGRSEGRRGHIKSYKQLDEMISITVENCRKTFPGIPVFIYGHSLGGNVVLSYLLRHKTSLRGAIVTSPWLRLSFEPPKVKVMMARIMNRVLPGLVQPSGLNVSHLSHLQPVVDAYRADPLVHDRISVSLFVAAMEAAAFDMEHASDLPIPTLLIHGSDDQITSPQATREFAEKSNLATFRLWEGGYHELHNEAFREEVFNYIISWMFNNKK